MKFQNGVGLDCLKSMQAWDLHAGAVIDILGRPTTLMKATAATVEWLDCYARLFYNLKLKLEVRDTFSLSLALQILLLARLEIFTF